MESSLVIVEHKAKNLNQPNKEKLLKEIESYPLKSI